MFLVTLNDVDIKDCSFRLLLVGGTPTSHFVSWDEIRHSQKIHIVHVPNMSHQPGVFHVKTRAPKTWRHCSDLESQILTWWSAQAVTMRAQASPSRHGDVVVWVASKCWVYIYIYSMYNIDIVIGISSGISIIIGIIGIYIYI